MSERELLEKKRVGKRGLSERVLENSPYKSHSLDGLSELKTRQNLAQTFYGSDTMLNDKRK